MSEQDSSRASQLRAWLEAFIQDNQAAAGTVHEREGELLRLRASVNIPPKVVAVTESIPKGKGMAGLAWERDAPVSTCNLKTDETGDVRPGAKAVEAKAAVALPVHTPDGQLCGIVGIAFMQERELSDAELARLAKAAASVPL